MILEDICATLPRLTLSSESIENSYSYAFERSKKGNNYSFRGGVQDQRTQIKQDLIGKMWEFALYEFLTHCGFWCSVPDTEIYPYYNKSFDADLTLNDDIRLHAKVQPGTSARRFGLSWTFQYADSAQNKSCHFDREIFETYLPEDRVALGVSFKKNLYLAGIIKVVDLHQNNLFGLPKKDSLKNSKRVVYFKDIANLPSDIRWSLDLSGEAVF